jgi:hypothetical protein
VPAISDILGVRSTTANDYLIACGLLMLHPTHGTVGPHRKSWESLKAMYQLEIELEQAQDIHFLGPKKQYFLRIGRLGPHNNNATFNAKAKTKQSDFWLVRTRQEHATHTPKDGSQSD